MGEGRAGARGLAGPSGRRWAERVAGQAMGAGPRWALGRERERAGSVWADLGRLGWVDLVLLFSFSLSISYFKPTKPI